MILEISGDDLTWETPRHDLIMVSLEDLEVFGRGIGQKIEAPHIFQVFPAKGPVRQSI